MKYICEVCGYVHEGDNPPAECPICHAPASAFKAMEEDKVTLASEHKIGVPGTPDDILESLRNEFMGECTEVGMYLAMARVAFREGYAEIGTYFEKAAYEEAGHASRYAELLGDEAIVTSSTKENLSRRVQAEFGACNGKTGLAGKAKELGLDPIHDSVHEMARDEARHGQAFEGLLKRYFG